MVATGPMPGKHADQRADEDAHEAGEEIGRREAHGEAVEEPADQLHGPSGRRTLRARANTR